MSSAMIIVDDPSDWAPFASGPTIVTAHEYLSGLQAAPRSALIINLCRDSSYHGDGYYVSLLAEARGRRVLPSVRTLLELGDSNSHFDRQVLRRPAALRDVLVPDSLTLCFGRCADPRFNALGAAIFNRYPVPIMQARLSVGPRHIQVDEVEVSCLDRLDDADETRFAEALDGFSSRVWRRPRQLNRQRYDLAMLVDPEDPIGPSNLPALRHFEQAGRALGFSVERIVAADSPRLLEFDALLIRCTTAIDHYTYQMARRAAAAGLAVIDDPESILRCCNKVFLHDLLASHHIAMPATRLLMRQRAPDIDALIANLGLPLVLKIPDGSFSRGVFKVEDQAALERQAEELFQSSAVIIAQAFVPTAFDWRIGVIDGRALYACRYHMAKGHWQIINHASRGGGRYGAHEAVPLGRVPNIVLRTAVKAARLVGDGLYGVDLKEIDGRALVIEINDNPSIDAGVEDVILGDELYRQIMQHLRNQVDARGR